MRNDFSFILFLFILFLFILFIIFIFSEHGRYAGLQNIYHRKLFKAKDTIAHVIGGPWVYLHTKC